MRFFMDKDIEIFICSILGFVLYIVIQFLTLRFIKAEKIIKGIVNIYLFTGFIQFLAESVWLGVAPAFYSFILYTLLVANYIIGIFGVIESSVRVRILMEINSRGTGGIKEKEINKKYNKKIILEKRLKRMIASGELKLEKGYYRRNGRLTFYNIAEMFYRIIWYLYQ